jgi:hypothetical protein
MKKIEIRMTGGMDCPGGEWTQISVDGVNKGRVYPDSNVTLGQVIQIILKDYEPDTEFECNNARAKFEYSKLISHG